MNKHSQSTAPKVQQPKDSQSAAATPANARKKHKCAGVNVLRMFLGVIAIAFVIVITGVQVSGWQAIADALFGGITIYEVVRQGAIVILSMAVGYWMKKPRKVYIKIDEKKNSETEKKVEE